MIKNGTLLALILILQYISRRLCEDLNALALRIIESPESKERFAQASCFAAEGDMLACEWCKNAFSNHYPLNVADFQNSFIEGNPCLWKELARKFDSGEVIHIGVMGGSMTAGRRCHDAAGSSHCAWPAKLEKLFNSPNVIVHNYAVPGADYDHYLASGDLQFIQCDLLLVDLAVNAQSYIRRIETLRSRVDEVIYDILKAHPERPLMWVTTYRAGGFEPGDRNGHCPLPEERGDMSYSFTGQPGGYFWCWYWVTIKDHEQLITSHYNIPVVSYRDAAWRGTRENGVMKSFDAPREDQVCFWNGWGHPSSTTHLLLADISFYSIHGMLNKARELTAKGGDCEVQRNPLHAELAIPHLCSAIGFITHMTSSKGDEFKPVDVSPHWRFREDNKGKPGWIIDLNGVPFAKNHISFEVEIGQGRNLETTYLKSYTKIGEVLAVLKNVEGTVAGTFRIEAWEEDGHASIPVTFQHKLHHDFQPGKYTVTYSLPEKAHYPKFKIISVSSC